MKQKTGNTSHAYVILSVAKNHFVKDSKAQFIFKLSGAKSKRGGTR